MKVEVVYARPEGAEVVTLELPACSTVRDALAASSLNLDLQNHAFGIFGKRATLDQPLAEGDRVEIYRPLAMDPREARRRRASRRKGSAKAR